MPKAPRTPASSVPSSPTKLQRHTAHIEAAQGESEPSVDESAWPESVLWKGRKIKKTDIKRLYRLEPADIAGLEYKTDNQLIQTKKRGNFLVDTFKYSEREVERVAWRKHGGPEGFKVYLDGLKQRWKKNPKTAGKCFPAPVSYV